MSHFPVLLLLSLSFAPDVSAGGPPPMSQMEYVQKYKNVSITVVYLPPNCTRKSKDGDQLTTNYVGYFPDGKKFDSTWDRGEPMTYVMGEGTVIKGAEIGAIGMCVGERRHTVMPPALAYGDKDYAQIPGGSTLVFDEVLMKLEDGPSKVDPMEAMGLVKNADGSYPLFK
ncbi:FK506-binding protein 2-like [Folsomia candida]|uniref:FK506-binding protein 2-like n=1 Tax=Folsomia candida TaxID=158441 RepID=UPI000B8F9915|nr:FK506-binding protein 2-like [Folsomia candida]